jgi:DNA modification methylase
MTPYYTDPLVTLLHGDCIEVMAGLEADSVDAVVTDPPYNLSFMSKSWDAFGGREDAGFAYWLAGLIDGEGHFAIKKHSRGTHAPYFQLKMRLDERGTIEQIHRHLRIGTITEEQRDDANPMVKWTVQDKEGCKRLVDLLDKYPLRAKKRLDYNIWRDAVCEWADRGRGNRWHGAVDDSRMSALRGRLMRVRNYVEPAWSGHEFQDWTRLWALEAFRVLKPGGYLLSFGGTRQYHRMTAGIEDAGFEIRDTLQHIYASGFPKGKANLKPAHEPIVLARKPGPLRPLGIDAGRIGTDGGGTHCSDFPEPCSGHEGHGRYSPTVHVPSEVAGRWPSNLLLSDPELFDQANPYVVGSGATTGPSDGLKLKAGAAKFNGILNNGERYDSREDQYGGYEDSGGYSRFFIIPKADRAERERGLAGTSLEIHLDGAFAVICAKCNRQKVNVPGAACKCEEPEWVRQSQKPRANVHPTVKPIDLMRHLVRLVTPVDGVVLDPFLGSGTTCLAASEEGFRSIGIEQSAEYLEIAKGRLMATPMGLGLDVPAPTTSRKVGRDKGGGTHCSFFPGKCEGHPGHGRYSPTIHANPNSEEPAA